MLSPTAAGCAAVTVLEQGYFRLTRGSTTEPHLQSSSWCFLIAIHSVCRNFSACAFSQHSISLAQFQKSNHVAKESVLFSFTRIHVVQVGLELLIFLPPPPKCWDDRSTPPPCPAHIRFHIKQGQCLKTSWGGKHRIPDD